MELEEDTQGKVVDKVKRFGDQLRMSEPWEGRRAWVKGSRDCRFLGWQIDFTFELWIAQRLFMLLLRHRGVLLDV
ncbi:hypothetical protein F2Q69_00036866 [Brassica cretica]|uniref:Uncharacterized protein n=1 Tax=Brassica cretica TaxID=69181 RepID=A0A8S9SGH9_BRACR|nr:hypothetical protein F2Q69_00036866 [Brassica cretica]